MVVCIGTVPSLLCVALLYQVRQARVQTPPQFLLYLLVDSISYMQACFVLHRLLLYIKPFACNVHIPCVGCDVIFSKSTFPVFLWYCHYPTRVKPQSSDQRLSPIAFSSAFSGVPTPPPSVCLHIRARWDRDSHARLTRRIKTPNRRNPS